ncbi:hypothetical protein [Arenibacterium sp. LLYu02]|uniref:hypothetical protein n=1 Tax=Arenibacterium sp. LLYu02 TaxID=3404132 RepID=UPI003B224C55
MAWKLFMHAVTMLIRNWREVVQIFLVPMVIVIVLIGLFFSGRGGFGMMLLIFLAVMLVFIWPIVSWHRFVLQEEPVTSYFPTFRLDRIAAYLLQGLLIGLIAAFPSALVIFVNARLSTWLDPAVMLFLQTGLFLLPSWILTRLSVTLPSVALGKKDLSLAKVWRATSDFGPIFGLTLIVSGIQLLNELVALALGGAAGVVWSIVVGVLFALVNISLLTTLYGHYVEKRPI